MAGETRGILAEAIAKVALDEALIKSGSAEKVFWEEPPKSVVVLPDLTIGLDKNHPRALILVNASDSVKDSDKKYWRNIGEIFDAKLRLIPPPVVLGLFFKSEIKPELIKLTSALCDSTHHVDLDPIHGIHISQWLEEHHTKVPSEKSQKEKYVQAAISIKSKHYDESFARAIQHLSNTLLRKLSKRKKELHPLWSLVQEDFALQHSKPVRTAHVTMFRRGLARWVIFEDVVREKVFRAYLCRKAFPKSEVPSYATALGMLELHIPGAYIPTGNSNGNDMLSTTASDLRTVAEFYKEAAKGNIDLACSALSLSLDNIPQEMLRAAELLRKMPLQVTAWHDYINRNWSSFISAEGCYQALLLCRKDASLNGQLEADYEKRVWLYDHLVSMIRTNSRRNNDFGYGALISFFKANQNHPRLKALFANIISGLNESKAKIAKRWVNETLPQSAEPGRRGFQDWLAGEKEVSPVIVAAFAFSLTNFLSSIKSPQKLSYDSLVSSHAYNLLNKLLTHQDFEPLVGLIQAACGNKVKRVSVPTVMADLADKKVQNAGLVPVLAFDGGLIYWKSAHGSHTNDKTKELCGRAHALRYMKTTSGFRERKQSQRLILVLDGTFNDSELKVLTESGWDEIYYPDEMDKLLTAIE